jgi:hypothetical protein
LTEINDGRWHHIAVSRTSDGLVILYLKGEQIGWNGQFSGKEATAGIYTYALVFSLVNGVEVVETGDVGLVR